MIKRDITDKVAEAAKAFPVVTITGPRQSGKSTLCKALFPKHPYANLEQPDIRSLALDDPHAFLSQYPDGAIIDEVQRCPELLSYIQVIVDDKKTPGQWILTGSQNLMLLESVSQSLAGRTAILHLLPLSRSETRRFRIHPASLDDVLLAGGYPAIFDRQIPFASWLSAYVATYVERDVRTIGKVSDLTTFQRFLELCAGRTAQLLNLSALASDAGISQPTARAWLSTLEASFLVFRLRPLHSNLRKRLVKMPKLHFYDTGLACWLLGIRTSKQLRAHPLRSAIFESWVVSEIVKHRMNRGESGGMFFFRDRHGVEADAIVEHVDSLLTIEVKAGETVTDDMLRPARRVSAILEPAGPVDTFVVYGGSVRQKRQDIIVLPWNQLDKQEWI